MQKVKNGDVINIHYTGTLSDGTVFDSSEGRDPLKFTVGEGMVITGFDKGVLDMEINQEKTININELEAYGPYNADMIIEMPIDQVPADMNPTVGMEVHLSDPEGNVMPVIVTELNDKTIKLDANHPLAGKDLTFKLQLVSIGE
jgi:FKBP-type peptidyl-prolyl cis-trans isomerase 2